MSDFKNFDSTLTEYILSIPDRGSTGGAEQFCKADSAKWIIDEMPGGFFIYRADEKEEIVYANKALFRIFGCETEEEFRALTGGTFQGLVYA